MTLFDDFQRMALDNLHQLTLPKVRKSPKPNATRGPRGGRYYKPVVRPFLGIDGEGCGRNRHGQQHYRLLTAANDTFTATLFTGKPLSTVQCLDWICALPPGPILVGFAFGYDASQILRDLPPERLSNASHRGIFDDKQWQRDQPRSSHQVNVRYTWFGDFGIEYVPRNYLRVCRARRVRRADGSTTTASVEGSARTIYDTFGFFQMAFLKALQAYDIGADHWAMIERNKDLRASFTRITREIRHYNTLECQLLAELMTKFRTTCHDAELRPKTWNGAGKLAAAEHDKHATINRLEVRKRVPDGCLGMAADAYYGGRFETTRVGLINRRVWEYDINSAYPAAMRSLPCLLHGTWEMFTGAPPPNSLHVAYVRFDHPEGIALCALPVRHRQGHLLWPRQGQGVYWSCELNAARRLGATIEYTAGWRYVRHCQCQPFDWIDHRYRQRIALGKDARGYPIKLALNSLYGKLAQRIGNPRWHNLLWAGLITAQTRAMLIDAARQAPDAIVMLATDALFSIKPLQLTLGDGLGEWQEAKHKQLFICQPGVYWGAKRPKTRGVPVSELTKHTAKFERTWQRWCEGQKMLDRVMGATWAERAMLDIGQRDKLAKPPSVRIPIPSFIGLRLAHARGKPETACRWIEGEDAMREFSFSWLLKRGAIRWDRHRGSCAGITAPHDGSPDLISVPHASSLAWSALNEARMTWEDQPEPVDFSPPD